MPDIPGLYIPQVETGCFRAIFVHDLFLALAPRPASDLASKETEYEVPYIPTLPLGTPLCKFGLNLGTLGTLPPPKNKTQLF